MKRLIGLSVLLVCAFSVSVSAAVVYSQPYTQVGAVYSDEERSMFCADDFVLGADYEITDVHWWGEYFTDDPASDDFTIVFYSDDGGKPGLPGIATYLPGNSVNRTDTGDTLGGDIIYSYFCYTLPNPLSLLGGETYYISIYNNTGPVDADDWAWMEGVGPNSTMWWRNSLSDEWDVFAHNWDVAFELTGEPTGGPVIPEPITSLLFGGSVLFGLARLRRRRS